MRVAELLLRLFVYYHTCLKEQMGSYLGSVTQPKTVLTRRYVNKSLNNSEWMAGSQPF